MTAASGAGADDAVTDHRSVLYVDDDRDESEQVDRVLADHDQHFDVEHVETLADALDRLNARGVDCVVADLDLADASPTTVATELDEATPETPLVGYTAIDFTNIPQAAIDALTTLVQKDESVHRRFLRNKILATTSEDDDQTRNEEVSAVFGDEQVGLFICESDGTVEHATTSVDDLFPTASAAATPSGTLQDQLSRIFTNGTTVRDRIETAFADDEILPGYVGELTDTDGTQRHYACWCVPRGEQAGHVVLLRDVTADIERREELDMLETLVDLAHDGLYALDANGRIDYLNDAFAEMLGYDRSELVGEFAYAGMKEGGLTEGQRMIQQVYENPDSTSDVVEQPFETEDGETVWLAVHTAAIPHEDGTYGGLVGVARNVTERKERERRLEAQQEQLEAKTEQLDEIAETVREEFREPLRTASRRLTDAIETGDKSALDDVEEALDAIDDHIADHLKDVRPADDDDIRNREGISADIGQSDADAARVTVESQADQAGTDDASHEGDDAGDDRRDDAGADEDDDTADETEETEVATEILHVDGDADARAKLADVVAEEPDIAIESVDSVAAARDANRMGCLVIDPATLAASADEIADLLSARTEPVVLFTTLPGRELDERIVDAHDSYVQKGEASNRAFLVEKVRSLTNIGRPGDVDIAWQEDSVETVGDPDDLFVAIDDTGQTTTQPPADYATTSHPPADFFPGVDDPYGETLADALANGQAYRRWRTDVTTPAKPFLCELPTDDGHRFYRCWRATLGGRTVELYRDVTDAVDRQDRLRRARTLVENARDGIYVYDENARYVYLNDAVTDILGMDRDELLGENVTEQIVPEDLEKGQQVVQNLVENPENESELVEMSMWTGDDELITTAINFTLTPFDEDGSYTGLMGVARDVTERKRREEKLRRGEERLRRTKELLERFASLVSHDLRNPLGVAQVYLDFARDSGDEADYAAVREALERMDEMLDELIDFARMGGELETREPVELCDLAADAWGTVDTDGGTLAVTAEDLTVQADRAKLAHVLENLFRNSIEYGTTDDESASDDATESGEDDVTVRVGPCDGGFYVADDGPGVQGDADRVFEYGYSSTSGTGIGLAIVKDVVAAHGWEITVTESESGGARFEITGVDDHR